MGRMQSKLVGAAGFGDEPNPGRVGRPVEDPKPGHPKAAVHRIEDLSRPVGGIQSEGERDGPLVGGDLAPQTSEVRLVDLAPLKLHAQRAMNVGIRRHDHEPRRVHIESMNGERSSTR